MTLVVDGSFAVAIYLPDETSPDFDDVILRIAEAGAVAPVHWRAEVANALNMAVRRSRIERSGREKILEKLVQLGIEIDPETNDHIWGTTLRLADLYGLTVYDAAYLELAQRLRVPLATLDTALAAAARKAGVEVLP